jgi:hypothetical protein
MASTEDHIRNAIGYLDPKQEIFNIDKARSEMRDALNHYYIEKEVSNEASSRNNRGSNLNV